MEAMVILGSPAYPFFSHLSRPFHVRRTRTVDLHELTVHDGARTTMWRRPRPGDALLETQTTHTPQQFVNVKVEENLLVPPYHWHWRQTEQFVIREGRFIFQLNGQTSTHDASSGPIIVPPRARHTFYADPSCATPCTVDISATASDGGVGECFFRNLYSYIDDCENQGVAPRVAQLILFIHAAEASIAVDGLPEGVMCAVTRLFGWVMGRFWGQWVCGYRSSYAEYYDERRLRGG